MKLVDLLAAVDAEHLFVADNGELKRDFDYISATDLMSDALAMHKAQSHQTVLVTGLVNNQSLRTAEMLDIRNIIFVRSKTPSNDVLALAEELNCNIFVSSLSMYETCGKLYSVGLRTATK